MNAVVRSEAQETTGSLMEVIARASSDPNVDVVKMNALLQMQERVLDRNAVTEFNAAMSLAQGEMEPVSRDATNPTTRSRYATYGKLDAALRPIYVRHGFALSYDSEQSPIADHIRVLCYVSHRAGHTRTYRIDMPTDGKGAKGNDVMTKTHATVAGMSYGKRHLLKAVFNVSEGEGDVDGNDASEQTIPDPPGVTIEAFKGWQADMEALADEGSARLTECWQKLGRPQREYVVKYYAGWWDQTKAKAHKVKA